MLQQKYHNFNYCIWLCPDKKSFVYGFTNTPHLSVHTHLLKEEAQLAIRDIQDHEISVEFIGRVYATSSDGFHALECRVRCIGKTPFWFPKNAHISLCYRYAPFREQEWILLDKFLPKNQEIRLSSLKIFNCSGHYSTWKELRE